MTEGDCIYIGHKTDDGNIQPLIDHLEQTAQLARTYADAFSAGAYGYCCGMLHDLGKYSEEFQHRIQGGKVKVDHATCGAKEIMTCVQSPAAIIPAYCIVGHHGGLPNGGSHADTMDEGTLRGRLKKNLHDYSGFKQEVDLQSALPAFNSPIRLLGKMGFSTAFFIRMLFSCLVDADFLDTEAFMKKTPIRTGMGNQLSVLLERLQNHLKTFDNPASDINQKRCEILTQCLQKSARPKGLFTLTVPTGGGKTLSSLAFALHHAHTHEMKRIIYVIPYTSIIEQNAAIFREILGEENVLEHHHNVQYEDEDEQSNQKRLAAENWDAPLVVTTNVQFFESLFSNKTSRCRKLHNLANAVIIFDEAQMIPREFLQPCIRAIGELTYNYGCTAVLCTATQPALHPLFPKEIKCEEICENTQQLYAFFKRTQMVQAGELTDDALSDALNAHAQVLCIVNSRKHAQAIFERMQGEGKFHLSTLMYPEHRKRVLDEIRLRLKDRKPCRVVSTSLIEAGVDVDFPVVYRASAGLDSQIQAAGRCNREGKRKPEESQVVLFEPEACYKSHMPSSLKTPIDVTKLVADQFDALDSTQAITYYFEKLYHVSAQGLDSKGIVDKLEVGARNGFHFPFADVAEAFRLIDSPTQAVLIPMHPQGLELASRLRGGEQSKGLYRKIGLYSVSIYPKHLEALYDVGAVEKVDEQISILTDPKYYSEQTGLGLLVESGTGIFV